MSVSNPSPRGAPCSARGRWPSAAARWCRSCAWRACASASPGLRLGARDGLGLAAAPARRRAGRGARRDRRPAPVASADQAAWAPRWASRERSCRACSATAGIASNPGISSRASLRRRAVCCSARSSPSASCSRAAPTPAGSCRSSPSAARWRGRVVFRKSRPAPAASRSRPAAMGLALNTILAAAAVDPGRRARQQLPLAQHPLLELRTLATAPRRTRCSSGAGSRWRWPAAVHLLRART